MNNGWQSAFAEKIGTSPANVSRWIDRGMPSGDDAAAEAWVAANTRHASRSPLAQILADATEDDEGPLGAYARARAMERGIFELIDGAEPRELLSIITAHTKAAGNLAERAKEAAAFIEQSKALMPTGAIQQAIEAHVGAVVQCVRTMPRSMAPRLAGVTQDAAERELADWGENKLLAILRATHPFKPEAAE